MPGIQEFIKEYPVEDLQPHPGNPRIHPDSAIQKLSESIGTFGFINPVILSKDGYLLAGHARTKASRRKGLTHVPAIVVDLEGNEANMYLIADNKHQENTEWDIPALKNMIEEVDTGELPIELTGFDIPELEELMTWTPEDEEDKEADEEPDRTGNLFKKFLMPPFSVLDTKMAYWQERKRDWLYLGIKSELGRDIKGTSLNDNSPEFMQGRGNNEGGSIFDPVLCELMYRWFSPEGGNILDPFAGGSVRGVVASKLSRQYVGVELRPEQVEANRLQAKELELEEPVPVWKEGDSENIIEIAGDYEADFVFSCPPYADLEQYSKDPRDISNMSYDEFLKVYRSIIRKSLSLLKENRFACFVVGDIRDKAGFYRNFVSDTIQAFCDNDVYLYNEAILVSPAGTLPIRASSFFGKLRKLGKQHQNVLIFYKGDPKQIPNVLGEINVEEILPDKEVLEDATNEAE